MFVKHLQEYLDQFTNGKKGNAVSNATIYMHVGGHLEEKTRIERDIKEAPAGADAVLKKELSKVNKQIGTVNQKIKNQKALQENRKKA